MRWGWKKAIGAAAVVAAGTMAAGVGVGLERVARGEEAAVAEDAGDQTVFPADEADEADEPADGYSPELFDPTFGHGGSCSCNACCPVECQDPPGLVQFCHEKYDARWTARVDALLLWRNSPRQRALFSDWDPVTDTVGDTAMDASDLESTMGSGPRISLFRTDCHGHTAEFTYFQAFNFLAREATVPSDSGYTIGPRGIYGNEWNDLDTGTARLTSGIKSFEMNGRKCVTRNISLLGGFRWVQWQESAAILDMYRTNEGAQINRDLYDTSTMNSLYGGQIGFDARMFDRGWLRIDAVMKGGAYYNIATQQSSYRNGPLDGPTDLVGRTYQDSGTAAFVGELGFMGTIPLTDHFEFTFGYLGLWLESLAQPTNQFRSQRIVPNTEPRGKVDMTGGTVLQGVTLGFNAKW